MENKKNINKNKWNIMININNSNIEIIIYIKNIYIYEL